MNREIEMDRAAASDHHGGANRQVALAWLTIAVVSLIAAIVLSIAVADRSCGGSAGF